MKRKIIFFIAINIIFFIDSETLWNDNYSLIYSQKINYKIGDSITIIVDEQSLFDYKSNDKSTKSVNINISGGEMSAILSFLPKGDIEENNNSNIKDQIKIKTVVQGFVTNIQNNSVTIQAQKTIIVNNKQSSIQIAGNANFSDITGNSILLSKLINPVITFKTLLDNNKIIINSNDIITEIINPDSTTDRKENNKLTDTKKKELLLEIFNKLLNLIF